MHVLISVDPFLFAAGVASRPGKPVIPEPRDEDFTTYGPFDSAEDANAEWNRINTLGKCWFVVEVQPVENLPK